MVKGLAAGRRVLVVGERGSGRTTTARAAVQELQRNPARGTALRLVDQAGFPFEMAHRGEVLAADDLLVVEDVQWADPDTLAALRAHDGPVLLTGLTGTVVSGVETVELLPLTDDEARALGADDDTMRRAGGNARLLGSLRPGEVPRGPAARTLRAMWDGLDDAGRHAALLCGVAGGPVGDHRVRVGALGELAVATATPEQIVAAHREVAALLTDPGDRAPHLMAAGERAAARQAALAAVALDRSDPVRTAALLALAAPLEDALADLHADALWRSWDLAGLLAGYPEPATETQQALVLKARTASGELELHAEPPAPAGAAARADLARGVLTDPGPGDVDAQIAAAAVALARGLPPPPVAEGDEEQRWQAAAITLVAAWLRSEPLPATHLTGRRWVVLDELLRTAIETERYGASAERAERLATGLVLAPVGWGHAALALCHAELGNATEAAAALAAARPTNALDTQVLALARAEAELATGRPRLALKALAGTSWWPALAPVAALAEHQARHAIGESASGPVVDGPAGLELVGDYAAASLAWQGISRRRERWSRFAGADVAGLRELEQEALDHGLMPLLARVREALRRQGVRLDRGTSTGQATGALSARETEVLHLVRDGLTSAQIATRLGVAQSTVETQVASAMRKLGARTRRHAVALLDAVPA